MQALNVEALWDEGIATYLTGEYEKRQQPLTADDLQRMANKQAVRVGDLLETLFLLAIYGAWHYCNEEGVTMDLDEEALDELYAKGRVGPDDLQAFDGVWIPSV